MIMSWLPEPCDLPFTIAVPGIRCAAWWPGLAPEPVAVAEVKSIWPSDTATIKLERDVFEEADGTKHQISAYVRIRRYPDHWLEVLEEALRYFVDAGAAISWAGGWEC